MALVPFPAYALDPLASTVPSALILCAAAMVVAMLLHRQRQHIAAIEGEKSRAAASSAARDAVIAASPAALFLLSTDGDDTRLAAGPLAGVSGAVRFSAFCALLEPAARTALQAAARRLEVDGTGFEQGVRLAADGRAFDVRGSRVAEGGLIAVIEASARQAAQAERDLLRQLVDATPRPMWRRRRSDLKLVDCNRAYAAAVDATVETAIAEDRELGAGVIPQSGKALAIKAAESGAPQAGRYHIVIGGSRRLIDITETPLGPASDIVGFARDLTELEDKGAELARHIAAHDEVLENIAVAIAIYGADTRLTFFNAAYARLWGLEEDWLRAKPNLDEVLERLRERRKLPELADFRSFKQQQRALFTSLIDPQEEWLHLPDGHTLRLVVTPHPFGGLIFAYEDVTVRLELEADYKTALEVQRETLDNLYEAIAVFGSDGRLKLWNPAYAQVWGLAAEDLTDEPHVADIIEKTRAFYDAGGDWDDLKRRVIARLTSHGAASTRLERQDGSILQAVTVPLPDGNILLSYLDVTDSTRVEHALRERNEALETAGRLKSEFIANVSYELRTPLNAIIGFAEILTNQYFGELNARQLDYSRGILESSNRLLSLINDILDLATIEAGYMQLETHEVDIHALMSSVLTFTRERARNLGLRLQFDCPTAIGAIQADEKRLKQALFNLVSNALKFTPSGGTVTLAAYRDVDRVALVVADTGVGVAREDQERIFEKFERGNPQMRQSGPGLGLSLVKSFIELHGGKIELDSHPGSGTTITCWLNDRAEAPAALRSVGT
jgi:signal transduction histidine kinase